MTGYTPSPMAAQPVLTPRDPEPVALLDRAPADIEVIPDEPPVPSRPVARGVLRAVGLYLASRVVVLLATIPSTRHGDAGRGPWPVYLRGTPITRALGRWDGAWYLWIERRGYPGRAEIGRHLSDVSFFPLYPMCVRWVSGLTGWTALTSALLLTAVLGAAATALVWVLANRLTDRRTADRAAALFAFFPGAFVLSMAYAEALMLVAVAACLLFLLDRRWILAGVAAAVATGTRPNALAVVIACAVVAVVEIRRHRDWWSLWAPAIGSVGIVGYFLYLWAHTGQLTVWFRSERQMWHDHISIGRPIVERFVGLVQHFPTSLASGALNDLIADIGIILVVIGFVLLYRSSLPLAIKVYTVFALLIPSTSAAVSPRPRLLLAAFPLAIVLATRLSPWAYRCALAVSVVGLAVMTYLTASTLAAVP